MKSKNHSFVFVLFLFLISAFEINTQTVGKVYTKQAADSIYGPVLNFTIINTQDLQSLFSKTNSYLMFKIIQDTLAILDDKRNLIYGSSFSFSDNDVFNYCSVSKIQELIFNDNNPVTYVENRQNVLTITNGGFTLEETQPCPPYCP
ncbi:MAG: hypothetical protein M1480_18495 [Bacteroidetes bacterium]|nr:hypothetical protein [Bacteroidota bacterium]